MQDRFKTIDHEKRPRGSNIVRVSSFFDRDTGKPAPASDTQYKHALRQGEDPGVISRIRERATMPDRDKAGAQAVVEMAAREAGMSPGDYVDNRLGALNAHQTLPGTINEMAHALPRGFVESLTALPDSISPGDDEDPESFAQRLFPNNPDYQHNLLVLMGQTAGRGAGLGLQVGKAPAAISRGKGAVVQGPERAKKAWDSFKKSPLYHALRHVHNAYLMSNHPFGQIPSLYWDQSMLHPANIKPLALEYWRFADETSRAWAGEGEKDEATGSRIIRRGTDKKTGRRVVQYEDGEIVFAE